MNEAKEPMSARINPQLLRRIEKLAEKQERSRSDMIERCLGRGVEAEEQRVELAESRLGGRVLELVMSKPMLRLMELVDGGSIDPEDLARTKELIVKARKARKGKPGIKEAKS